MPDARSGVQTTVRHIARRGAEAWDGYPPDRTLEGYHWLQHAHGGLVACRYLPRAGGFPGGWETCGFDRLWSEKTLAKDGWRYVAPIAWPQYQWIAKPRVRVQARSASGE